MAKKIFQEEIDVLGYQRTRVVTLAKDYAELDNDISEMEEKLSAFIKAEGLTLETNKTEEIHLVQNELTKEITETKNNRSFDDLLKDARNSGFKDMDLEDIATREEVNEANSILLECYNEFSDQFKLDKYDYAIAGIIGSLAALMDFFLVTKVSGNDVTPGKLKNCAENFWNKILSEEKIKELEKKYQVVYDISQNTGKAAQEVLGLCPLYHRFQSLGHDPIIGFVFGVADLMKGQLTAIDGNGRLIIQTVNGAKEKSFIESIITVFGHFLSDVGTKSPTGKILSVPAPLTPLLQLIQVGSIEYNGKNYTVGDLSKKMYGDGYNFNHFIGMSLPVLLIEVLTRLSFVIKEIFFTKSDVSIWGNPKLTIMLCIANGILFAENVGKLAVTKNPFAINYVSWIAMAKYGFKTMKWLAFDKGMGEIEYAQSYIDLRWEYLLTSAETLNKDNGVYLVN